MGKFKNIKKNVLFSMTRRDFLKISGSIVFATFLDKYFKFGKILAEEIKPKKPNIILILADDLGYNELSCYGCKDIPTPNIDSIAENGVRFTQGYVTSPVCAPTRAGLLTGRYQQRYGFETNPGPEEYADEKFGLPLDQPTLAERLKEAGYVTAIIGKWHLGYKPELTPTKRGFDEFFGFLGGAHMYFPDNKTRKLFHNTEMIKDEKEYLTDAFSREASLFIKKNKDNPFFLYFAFNAVHTPLEATEKYLKRVEEIKDQKRRIFGAMKIAMDDAVGCVLNTLKEEGLEENTIIFFLSDNGGPRFQTTSSNSPLRGDKGQLYEGGIRVPFLMQWKGKIPEGKLFNEPVSSLDIVPTVLSAIGIQIKPEDKLDGVNLLPYVKGEKSGKPHDVLYWRYVRKKAIRLGDWKLIKESENQNWELYNISEDIGETKNLAEKMPEKVKEMEKLWEEWNSQLQAPKWFRQDVRTKKLKNILKEKR